MKTLCIKMSYMKFCAIWYSPKFCFAKTFFMLGTLYEIPKSVKEAME
jgi:hypothetical protein